jgi:16S rRNA processing protein RimM
MFIAIGKIIQAHGTNGYFKAIPYSGILERFLKLKTLYLETDGETKGMILEDVILQDKYALLKFKNINNREDVLKFVQKDLLVLFEEKIELPENNYFIHDLIGLKVFDIDGNYLGVIENVLQMGANDVYRVMQEDNEILIPAVFEFVKDISLKEKKMVVKLIEGMQSK